MKILFIQLCEDYFTWYTRLPLWIKYFFNDIFVAVIYRYETIYYLCFHRTDKYFFRVSYFLDNCNPLNILSKIVFYYMNPRFRRGVQQHGR